jgi:ubiquinone/menaquinone biosynthesis C-methylase UbiE
VPVGTRRQGSRRGARALTYDAEHTAAFYDEYGEREWTRFEDGRNSFTSLEVHRHYLRRFVQPGDRVLDVGAGPGRFTIELAQIGAMVTVADISPRQLDLNRERVTAAGLEERVADRVVADVTNLSSFGDGEFDAVVCFGGPLSYVVERAEQGVAELARVARPGGHLLVSAMSLVGAVWHYLDILLELVERDGVELTDEIIRTGFLPEADGYGHLPMRLFRWRELKELLSRHGEVVAASAAGLFKTTDPDNPVLRDLLVRLELELSAEPGAIDGGEHMLAVVLAPNAE